jgi:Zn-dependent metalloprotease
MNNDKQQAGACTIIPPHIMSRIAENGSAGDRRRIAATRARSGDLTAARALPHHITGPAVVQITAAGKRRKVYDARHDVRLPGRLVLAEGETKGRDLAANEAYDGAGATYDFYEQLFGRRSLDGKSLTILSTVHYGRQFDNALWNGKQVIYGDGDGRLFNRFTVALDVIGHELTHGVTQFTAGLAYTGQTGALNEHLSDVFGILIKQHRLGLTADQSDWLIGAGLLGPKVRGKAIRSMASPGTAYDDPVLGADPQPWHMRDYQDLADDSGGVHINSGIPNHAFYLTAIAIGGHAWEVAGRVWYDALTRHLRADADFADFAQATLLSAGELFGAGGTEQRAIANAWAAVGLPTQIPRAPAAQLTRIAA